MRFLVNFPSWKRPLRSPSPTVNLALPSPSLNHIPKHHIYTSFKHLQGCDSTLGSLYQCLATLSVKKFFLISNLNLPWRNLRPFSLVLSRHPPHYNLLSGSNKVSPQPPFLQAKQPQFPQPLPISLVLQTLHQLRCPSLDTLQHLNVSLGVRGPKLNTGFKVQPHHCQVQWDNHFPSPADHSISDTSQDAIGLLGHLGTLLVHIQLAVDQHFQVLFRQAAFQPLFPKTVALHRVVVTQVQDPALSLVDLIQLALAHRSSLSRSLCRAFLPSSRSTLPHNLVSSANLLRVHSIPSSWSLIRILNRTGPNTEPWGTSLVTGYQLDLTPFTTTLWAQPPSQFFTQQSIGLSKP
ncbi:hypothetical protein QYF61_026500 [Mycteria americana]|uniref:Uncharacterized protein n=1 Tax=Mycteria americana TaxID=33587 RepID=A0AAN7ND55_MYCAM|nr:hypothetical protein QYF61_026500 [Mycteria americana]